MFLRGGDLQDDDHQNNHDCIEHESEESQAEDNGDQFGLGDDLGVDLLEAEGAFNGD